VRITPRTVTIILAFALLLPGFSSAQSLNLKEIQSRVYEYKNWLDQVGSMGARYWVRLDSNQRPHRLYVGEGFISASANEKEQFVEIFSRYLAGHPERNMLIDIFDAATGNAIGEYGFGGFRLFTASIPLR
jgi:hypothetical protein